MEEGTKIFPVLGLSKKDFNVAGSPGLEEPQRRKVALVEWGDIGDTLGNPGAWPLGGSSSTFTLPGGMCLSQGERESSRASRNDLGTEGGKVPD